MPGKPYEVLAVGSDRMITSNAIVKKGTKEMMPDDLPNIISQLVITPSGKSVIAGVGEPERPGAIQIWSKLEDKPLDKLNEVQAHSKGVEKLRLSHDCLNLFSVGMDGLICIFEVRDRDPRSQNKAKEELKFSQEILTLQSEMEKQLAECETLK